jgi:thiamine-monophosphate kinase
MIAMSEASVLQYLRSTAKPDTRIEIGIGDDLAALRWNSNDLLLVGADQVLDGIHFDSRVHTPRAIGRKVMNRNLSDCAAMACVPVAAIATLAIPRGSGETTAIEIIEGIRGAGAPFHCPLTGGDTGSWDGPLAVTVTILARSAGIDPIKRSGACAGDKLFVTGPLGGSILHRHMEFVPRVDWAIELAARFEIHAMLDISDGLSRDLKRMCDASGVAAMLDAERIPIHEDVAGMTGSRTPLEHALHDGEDHELLFAAPSCDHPHAIEIGQVLPGTGVFLRQAGGATPLEPRGWDHSL